VDGVPVSTSAIDEVGGKCRAPFRHPAPCADSAVVALSVNTAQLPDGPHNVRLVVTDATGSNSATYGPVEVITANGTPPSLNRLQAIACASPTKLVRLNVKPLDVVFGQRTRIFGRAMNPIPGAMMAVNGTGAHGVGVVMPLDPAGRFRTKIRPSESQTLRAVLLSPGGAPQCSRQIPMKVRAKSTAHVARQRLRNRQALRLTGRVLGTTLPRGGVRVVVRVRGAGSRRWFKAGTIRSDPSGRWRWRYRFRRTHQRTTYIFQARVPRQPQFPYAGGGSRSVRVTVVP
jgi:hypothetical protein